MKTPDPASCHATVFAVCYQVLRSIHDAEDAAQDSLVEIARESTTVRDERAFKGWICRVALHTALDHLKRRKRREHHEERKAAMVAPSPDPARDSLHEALARLDDHDRCLLVEKYFERATLEEIGQREGISAAAVGKRVDRAKQRLKQRLIQAGLASVALAVDSELEATPAVPPVPAHLSLPVRLVASTTIGMPAIWVTVMVIAPLLVGSTAWVFRPRNEGSVPLASKSEPDFDESKGSSPPRTSPETGAHPASSGGDELLSRLRRFRAWYDRVNPPQTEATFSLAEGPDPSALSAEIEGLRELILMDPPVFLEWIALPENLRGLPEILSALAEGAVRFEDLPPRLMEGLLILVQTSPVELQETLLSFAGGLKGAPEEWRATCLDLILRGKSLGSMEGQALRVYWERLSLADVHTILKALESSRNQALTTSLIENFSSIGSAEIREVVLRALESGRVPDPQGQASISLLSFWLQPENRPDDSLEDRASELFSRALKDDRPDIYRVIMVALSLAPHRAEKVIILAFSQTTKAGIHQALQEILGPVRAGDRTPTELKSLWGKAWRGKHIPAGGVFDPR